MTPEPTNPQALRDLALQRRLGRLAFPAVGLGCVFTMRVIRNNRLRGVADARLVFNQALATGRPTVICCNHLTMTDSGYLAWALAPLHDYLLHYERFPWNVAAIEHFADNPLLRALLFFAKTMPIDRGGDDAHRRAVLAKMKWLVAQGELLTLFPEGTRSRTGRIDPVNVTYGIGQVLKDLDRPQVICAYLRGRHQRSASGVPPWGDLIDVKLELLEPSTTETGLRAARELSRQVIHKLKQMEDAWLAQN